MSLVLIITSVEILLVPGPLQKLSDLPQLVRLDSLVVLSITVIHSLYLLAEESLYL